VADHRAFWIDTDHDREHAAHGTSRYGEVVASNLAEFSDTLGDIAPVRFACVAWRLAVPPALDPGYLRWHRRVLTAEFRRNEWDGGLLARVELVSPRPAALTESREWWHDRGWRDWPEVFGQYVQPSEQDLSRVPFLRASVLIETPIPVDDLPPAPEDPAEVTGSAPRAVAVLARSLNDVVTPILRQLVSVPGGSHRP
jgi:hypothetical protein